MKNNDETILTLKKEIERKREKLGAKPTFLPKSKCIFTFNSVSYNINVLKQPELELLHTQFNVLNEAAKSFNYKLQIDNCSIDDLITDVENKLKVIKYNTDVKQFEQLENKLTSLMSEDVKTNLELNAIMDILKLI